MPATGGSIESVSLKGREFPVASDAEVQRKLGGYENEYLGNGDGTGRVSKTRIGWSLSGLVIEVDDDRGDHEFLQDIINLKAFFPVAITYASSAVWQGTGQVVGENQASSKSSTASIDLMGQGVLSKQ